MPGQQPPTYEELIQLLNATEVGMTPSVERRNKRYELASAALNDPSVTPEERAELEAFRNSKLAWGGTLGNIGKGLAYGALEGALTPIAAEKLLGDSGTPTWGNTAGRIAGNVGGFLLGPGKLLKPLGWAAKSLPRMAGLLGAYGAAQGAGAHMENERLKAGEREFQMMSQGEAGEDLAPNPWTSARTGGNIAAQALTSALGGRFAHQLLQNPTARNLAKNVGSSIVEGVTGAVGQNVDAYGKEAFNSDHLAGTGVMATLGASIPAAMGGVQMRAARRLAANPQPQPADPLTVAPTVAAPTSTTPLGLSPAAERLLNIDPSAPLGVDEHLAKGVKLAEMQRMGALNQALGDKTIGNALADTTHGRAFASDPDGNWREIMAVLDQGRVSPLGTTGEIGNYLLRSAQDPKNIEIAREQAFLPGQKYTRQRFVLPDGQEIEIPEGMAFQGRPSRRFEEGGGEVLVLYKGTNSSVVKTPDGRLQVMQNADLEKLTPDASAPTTPFGPSSDVSRQLPMDDASRTAALREIAERFRIPLDPNAPPEQVAQRIADIDSNLRTLRVEVPVGEPLQGSMLDDLVESMGDPNRWYTPSLDDPNQFKLPFEHPLR